MTTVARPSTPFPHTHILTHSRRGSSYQPVAPQASYFVRPLHFSMPQLPSPTPPSLLTRCSSSGSLTQKQRGSAATSPTLAQSPQTPALVARSPRRSSSSSESSTLSPSLPVTPNTVIDELPLAPHPTPLELPSPMYPKARGGLSLPPPEYNWSHKDITPSTSFDVSIPAPDCLGGPMYPPPRPALKRRDTPRPESDSTSALQLSTDAMGNDRSRPKRRLTSMVDGGEWVIME